MPRIKINRKKIDEIMTPEKTTLYYDETLTGFGFKITPTGAKSWFIEYRPGAGGRSVAKKRMRIGGMELSPEHARSAATKLLASVSLGEDPASGRAEDRKAISMNDLIDAFMDRHVEKKRKLNSINDYRGIFDVHVRPAIGKKAANKVTRSDISKMHEKIAIKQAGQRQIGGTYVANKALAIVSAMFNWAALQGLIVEGHNPATKIEKFKEQQRERYLTGEEIERLGAVLVEAETTGLPYNVKSGKEDSKHHKNAHVRRIKYDLHITGAIRLLMLTGCRLREILNLRWSEIDFERGILFLPDSKSGKKSVILSRAAIEVLAVIPQRGTYVVASESVGMKDEKPRHDIKKPWAMITQQAGLEGLRIHDLRHTFWFYWCWWRFRIAYYRQTVRPHASQHYPAVFSRRCRSGASRC